MKPCSIDGCGNRRVSRGLCNKHYLHMNYHGIALTNYPRFLSSARKGSLQLAPTPFEQFASEQGHDIASAVHPAPDRVYADRQTQEHFETWNASARYFARMLTESTLETPALRERIRKLAGDA